MGVPPAASAPPWVSSLRCRLGAGASYHGPPLPTSRWEAHTGALHAEHSENSLPEQLDSLAQWALVPTEDSKDTRDPPSPLPPVPIEDGAAGGRSLGHGHCCPHQGRQ